MAHVKPAMEVDNSQRRFPLPSEIEDVPGAEGWRSMYPYYTGRSDQGTIASTSAAVPPSNTRSAATIHPST